MYITKARVNMQINNRWIELNIINILNKSTVHCNGFILPLYIYVPYQEYADGSAVDLTPINKLQETTSPTSTV